MKGMRTSLWVALFVTLLFSGGYFYHTAQAVCPAPLHYKIGDLDSRFDLTKAQAKSAISDAAEVWESATGRNLFTYDEDAPFQINFVYDQRQAYTNAEDTAKQKLDAAQQINDAIGDTYTQLVEQYNQLHASYQQQVDSYDKKLDNYNNTVANYNAQGGAPQDVYDHLKEEKQQLDDEQASLQDLADQLNTLVNRINQIGDQGNSLVKTYNQGVGQYNETFGKPHEFTQGDYEDNFINIYSFANRDELQLVLAHELGHALSLHHVEGSSSIMYYLIGNQPDDLHPSTQDIGEFNRVCGDSSLLEKLLISLHLSN